MTKLEAIYSIIEYFENNESEFIDAIEEVDNYSGYLGDDRYYSMDDFNELFANAEPSEIVARTFYGYDEDYTDSNGEHREPFNPNRDFFRFNGYGNLVSASKKDYSVRLDIYFVEELLEDIDFIAISDAAETFIRETMGAAREGFEE